jgi:galactokinase
MKTFLESCGQPPDAVAEAPGRVNLLGDHTDYNDGFVLPTAIPQRTRVSVAVAVDAGDRFTLYSTSLDQSTVFTLETPPVEHHASYVFGCLKLLQGTRGVTIPPLKIHVDSTVPMGVGLSSSAALEVACLRVMRTLLSLDLDDVEIARLAQRAEIGYAGVNCGIMDQMASSLADEDSMLFLDTRTLARELLPFPSDAELLVLDSGVTRSLAESGYNRRRAECETACGLLQVAALRDVPDAAAVEGLPGPLRRRARHVVSENARVLEAARGVGAERFGVLMNQSHASLRDDYEVSVAEVDRLVDLLQRHPAVYGARITGGGFGGACVALCRTGQRGRVAGEVLETARQAGLRPALLVPPAIAVDDPPMTFGDRR